MASLPLGSISESVVSNTAHEIARIDLPLSAIKERAASRTRFVVLPRVEVGRSRRLRKPNCDGQVYEREPWCHTTAGGGNRTHTLLPGRDFESLRHLDFECGERPNLRLECARGSVRCVGMCRKGLAPATILRPDKFAPQCIPQSLCAMR